MRNIMISKKDNAVLGGSIYRDSPGMITMLPGHTASEDYGFRSQYENVVIATTVAALFPGVFTQLRGLPYLLRGQLSASTVGVLYGPTILGVPTFTGMAIDYLLSSKKSRGQDKKSGTLVPPVLPKTPRGTKPSRRASPGKTSKPFWSNGKPKCKKGFRYDFKRKLCVKIK